MDIVCNENFRIDETNFLFLLVVKKIMIRCNTYIFRYFSFFYHNMVILVNGS